MHRDIKPGNFLLGVGKYQWLLYVIDFGLAKQYQNPKTQEHIRFRNKKSITGTAAFLSINTHLGMEQSRRDDIESIGYTLLYLATGSLPWQACTAKDKIEECNKIKGMKMRISTTALCKGLPSQFESYFKYCKKLRFTEQPNYLYLRNLFKQVMTNRGYINNYKYDWIVRTDDGRAQSREEVDARLQTYSFWDSDIELDEKNLNEESEESEDELIDIGNTKDEIKAVSAKFEDKHTDKKMIKRRRANNRGLSRREMTTEARVNESRLIYLRVFKLQEYEKLMKTMNQSMKENSLYETAKHT